MVYLMYIGNLFMNFAIFYFITTVLFKRDEIGETLFVAILVSFLQTYYEIKDTNFALHMVLIFLLITVGGRIYRKITK